MFSACCRTLRGIVHPLPLPLLGLLLLAACAKVSGDVVAGDTSGSWRLSERVSPIQGGERTAARTALERAGEFCGERGQRLVPLNAQETGWPIQQEITGPTGLVLDFRCASMEATQMSVGQPD
jgi:hypothetical protein